MVRARREDEVIETVGTEGVWTELTYTQTHTQQQRNEDQCGICATSC